MSLALRWTKAYQDAMKGGGGTPPAAGAGAPAPTSPTGFSSLSAALTSPIGGATPMYGPATGEGSTGIGGDIGAPTEGGPGPTTAASLGPSPTYSGIFSGLQNNQADITAMNNLSFNPLSMYAGIKGDEAGGLLGKGLGKVGSEVADLAFQAVGAKTTPFDTILGLLGKVMALGPKHASEGLRNTLRQLMTRDAIKAMETDEDVAVPDISVPDLSLSGAFGEVDPAAGLQSGLMGLNFSLQNPTVDMPSLNPAAFSLTGGLDTSDPTTDPSTSLTVADIDASGMTSSDPNAPTTSDVGTAPSVAGEVGSGAGAPDGSGGGGGVGPGGEGPAGPYHHGGIVRMGDRRAGFAGMRPGGDEDRDGRRNVMAMLEEGEQVLPADRPGFAGLAGGNLRDRIKKLSIEFK